MKHCHSLLKKIGTSLFCILNGASFLSLMNACGTSHEEDFYAKISAAEVKQALPTLKNFDSWRPSWNSGSWIVSLQPSQSLIQNGYFKSELIELFLGKFVSPKLDGARAAFGSFLKEHLTVEIIPLSSSGAVVIDNNIAGFASVYLGNSAALMSLMNHWNLPFSSLYQSKNEKDIAKFEWELLKNHKDVVFAEPNLNSHLAQDNVSTSGFKLPSEFDANVGSGYSKDVDVTLKRIKLPEALKYIYDQKLPVRDIVVAVIDTGVDSAHPDLQGQMFEAPEAKGTYGIDATIPIGTNDTSAEPQPKWADLGGPGATCPSKDSGSAGRSESCGHGTHVAGIIAAKANTDLPIMGVCQHCKILAIRAAARCLQPYTALAPGKRCQPVNVAADTARGEFEDDGKLDLVSQIRGLTYILNFSPQNDKQSLYVNIVNMSLGTYFYNRAMASVTRALAKNGVIIVAAAGNDNTSSPMFPAGYDSVVAVCATSRKADDFAGGRGEYAKTDFSNFGDWVDICAPGAMILSSVPGKNGERGNLRSESGTSQATPLVAGAIGLLRSAFPDKSGEELVKKLKRFSNFNALYDANLNPMNASYGGKVYGGPFYLLGAGFLDIEAAMKENREVSLAYSDSQFGSATQPIEGCVMNSIGTRRQASFMTFLTSMPFLLGLFFVFLKLKPKRMSRDF